MDIDKRQLNAFYEAIYKPFIEEGKTAFFLSLSARRKYTRPDEDIALDRKAEMLGRDMLAKDSVGLLEAKLHRLLANDSAYLDTNGNPIPERLKVLYVAVNPVDTISSYCLFTKRLAERNEELIQGRGRNLSPFMVPSLWWTSCQNGSAMRGWMDIDIDAEDGFDRQCAEDEADEVLKNLVVPVSYHKVRTQGGLHLLVSLMDGNFSRECNPLTIIERLQERLSPFCKEVKRNGNNLIPCPGTVQNGHLVTFE